MSAVEYEKPRTRHDIENGGIRLRPDVRVDYVQLEDCHATAVRLKNEFDGLPARVSRNADCWGDDQISAAVHTFGTNWEYHREKLSELIEKTGEKVETCLASFRKTDADWARQAERLTSSGPRGGA